MSAHSEREIPAPKDVEGLFNQFRASTNASLTAESFFESLRHTPSSRPSRPHGRSHIKQRQSSFIPNIYVTALRGASPLRNQLHGDPNVNCRTNSDVLIRGTGFRTSSSSLRGVTASNLAELEKVDTGTAKFEDSASTNCKKDPMHNKLHSQSKVIQQSKFIEQRRTNKGSEPKGTRALTLLRSRLAHLNPRRRLPELGELAMVPIIKTSMVGFC